MKRSLFWLLPVLLAGCDLDLTGIERCDLERDFSDFADARTATAVLIDSEAGDLQVVGRSDLNEVRVRGVGCAQDRFDLDEIELVVQRSGSTVRVLGLVPSGANVNARLDLVIEVPDWMLVDIADESGDIEVANVGAVTIADDSGDILVEDIAGDVDVTDDSGELWLRRILGDVYIWDDSGSADVREVHGGVLVDHDGSGNLFIRDVDLDVYIGEDGSGDIVVENVAGDFTVDVDGSGSISYRNIGGRVSVPR
jgi:hypothetical protein